MYIIGRKDAKRELRKSLQSDKSKLICVYGRRRVGKTYLVEQFFDHEFAFHAVGVDGADMRQQLRAFAQRLRMFGDKEKTTPKDWYEAFGRLQVILSSDHVKREPTQGRKIVFFDEFPWFAGRKHVFLQAFSNFWNSYAGSDPDLIVIICGSSTSWIIDNVVNNVGGLFDRTYRNIHLKPFSLTETATFLKDRRFEWDRPTIIETQAVFGGLPYFLDLLDPDESLAQNIDKLCFSEHAKLKDETNRLLETTLRKSNVYGTILEELANHRDGMVRQVLEDKIGVSHKTFVNCLQELVKCGYVKQTPVPHRRGNALFVQLIDPFILFHYKFIDPFLDDGFEHWQDFKEDDSARYFDWRGHAFEILCQRHVDEIKIALGISGVNATVYPWRSNDAQIDLVIQRADGIINICEMKFVDRQFSIDAEYKKKLLNKKQAYKNETKTKSPIKIVFITVNGFKWNQYADIVSQAIDVDDLF